MMFCRQRFGRPARQVGKQTRTPVLPPYRIKQLRYCRSPQGRQHRICFIRQVHFKDEITAAAFLYSPPRGVQELYFYKGGMPLIFFYFASSVNVLYPMFGIIFMKFWCHFTVIFGLFWGHFGVISVPRPQNRAWAWFFWFWLYFEVPLGALGAPWRRPFGLSLLS